MRCAARMGYHHLTLPHLLATHSAQLASKEAQIHTLRAELAASRRSASDAEIAAANMKRAMAARQADVEVELTAARSAAAAAAESAAAAAELPAGGHGASTAELLCVACVGACGVRDACSDARHRASHAVRLWLPRTRRSRRCALSWRRTGTRPRRRRRRRTAWRLRHALASAYRCALALLTRACIPQAASLQNTLLAELAAAKAGHEAAEHSAADLANNAANVMQALSDQLGAEREAREAAEDALANIREGRPADAARSERSARKSGSGQISGGGGFANAAFFAPGVLRGVAAGLLCGFVVRFGAGALNVLASRVTDKTGASLLPPPPPRAQQRRTQQARRQAGRKGAYEEEEPQPQQYRRVHY